MARSKTTNGTKAAAKESWLRRIVPAGYAQATLILTGISPLLMSSAEGDRDSETYRAYHLLGKKRNKSLDDEKRLRELEWTLRIYLDQELGPYWPGRNIKKMMSEAATKWRKGEEIKRSLAVVDYRIPILYDGPRDQEDLWRAGFKYETMVANAGAGSGRVVRCRPKFDDWSIVAELAYDPEDLDFDLLELVAERAKKYGLGDYRPAKGGDFGQFDAVLEPGETHKLSANGKALQPIAREALQAHVAFVDRIMVGANA